MIGMPSPSSLKTPGVMSTAELAAWAQIGRNTVPQLVGRFGSRELTGNAKKLSGLTPLRPGGTRA